MRSSFVGHTSLDMTRCVLLASFLLGVASKQFDPVVTPSCEPDVDVCTVTLTVARFETMTLIDYEDGTSTPVIEVNGTLCKRNRLLSADCDDVTPLTEQGQATNNLHFI